MTAHAKAEQKATQRVLYNIMPELPRERAPINFTSPQPILPGIKRRGQQPGQTGQTENPVWLYQPEQAGSSISRKQEQNQSVGNPVVTDIRIYDNRRAYDHYTQPAKYGKRTQLKAVCHPYHPIPFSNVFLYGSFFVFPSGFFDV